MIPRYSEQYLHSLSEHLESNSQQLVGKNSHITTFEPHQQEAMILMGEAIASGKRKFSIVQPGGSGKTILQAGLALSSMQVREKLRKEGILEKDAHRKDLIITTERQLVAQIREKIAQVLGLPLQDIGIWGGGTKILDREISIVTLQSLKRNRSSLERSLPIDSHNGEGLDMIQVDEADIALTELGHETIGRLIGILDTDGKQRINTDHPLLVGLTATDHWNDGRDIDDLFGEKIHQMNLKEGILQGINAPPVAYIFEANIDESAIKRAGEDYDEASLAAGLKSAEIQKGVVEVWERLVGMENRKKYPTLIFVPSVSLVEETVDIFQKRYGSSLSVTGWTGDTKTANDLQTDTHDFNNGKIDILICCQMGGRGMDVPRAACLIDGFPTLSETKGNQRWSRALRKVREGSDVQKTGFEKNLALIAHIIPRANKFRPFTLLDLLEAWEGFEQGDMVKPDGKPIPPPDEYRGRSIEEDIEKLRERIRRTKAFGEATILEIAKVDVLRKLRQEYPPRDEAYYRNTDNVKHDLDAYAKAAGFNTIAELNTKNIDLYIICKNSEEVRGGTYINNAGFALGIIKNWKEISGKRTEILKALKKIAGLEIKEYIARNKAYYENSENVKSDLEAYINKAGLKSIVDLNTDNFSSVSITCKNGEEVRGQTYIKNAGVALGVANNSKEAQGKGAEILKALKKTAGLEIKEYIPRDKTYYENIENVKHDLGAYAKAREFKSIAELNTDNFSSVSITCKNGEEVRGQTYINNAGVALGMAKGSLEAWKKIGDILKTLKKIAGLEIKEYIPRDKTYYENIENVKHDLGAYAKAREFKSIAELNTKNFKSQSINCKNGEEVNGMSYILNAGVALGMVEDWKEAQRKGAEILKALKKIAGLEIKDHVPRDESYYRNPENLKHDLEAYAKAAEFKTIVDLNTRNISSLSITCKNGEKVRGMTYILNAGVALGMGKNVKEASGKGAEILKALKEIASKT